MKTFDEILTVECVVGLRTADKNNHVAATRFIA